MFPSPAVFPPPDVFPSPVEFPPPDVFPSPVEFPPPDVFPSPAVFPPDVFPPPVVFPPVVVFPVVFVVFSGGFGVSAGFVCIVQFSVALWFPILEALFTGFHNPKLSLGIVPP